MKKHKLVGLSLIAIITLSLVFATILFNVDTVAETEDLLPQKTPITAYQVAEEEITVVERTIGTIEANQSVNIMAAVSGEVIKLHTYVGDQVNKNEVVMTIRTVSGQEVKVVSPIRGRISTLIPQRGEMIGPMMVAQVVNDSWLIAKTQVTAEQLKQLKLLDTVRLYLDGDEERLLNGYVGHINDVATTRSGLYEVEVEIISATNNVAVGEFAYIDFVISEEAFLVVPKQVVKVKDDTYTVYRIDGDQVSEQVVEVGPERDGKIAILSGLDNTMLVASLGNQYLEDGELVEVMN
jgi:multidrug efflux pump subunit AcrA (membrane-fusion protein)